LYRKAAGRVLFCGGPVYVLFCGGRICKAFTGVLKNAAGVFKRLRAYYLRRAYNKKKSRRAKIFFKNLLTNALIFDILYTVNKSMEAENMKTVVELTKLVPFTCDGTPRAPFTFDGGKTHKNRGQAAEICGKDLRGLALDVQSGLDFTKACDIPEYEISVKSAGATIPAADKSKVYSSLEEYIDEFIAADCAKSYVYGIITTTHYIEYSLSKELMRKFLKRCGQLTKNVVRLPRTDTELVVKWLETNAARA